jgi:hypothetical protein
VVSVAWASGSSAIGLGDDPVRNEIGAIGLRKSAAWYFKLAPAIGTFHPEPTEDIRAHEAEFAKDEG